MEDRNIALLGFVSSAADYLKKQINTSSEEIKELDEIDLDSIKRELDKKLSSSFCKVKDEKDDLISVGRAAFNDFINDSSKMIDEFNDIFNVDFKKKNDDKDDEMVNHLMSILKEPDKFADTNELEVEITKAIDNLPIYENKKAEVAKADEHLDSLFSEIVAHENKEKHDIDKKIQEKEIISKEEPIPVLDAELDIKKEEPEQKTDDVDHFDCNDLKKIIKDTLSEYFNDIKNEEKEINLNEIIDSYEVLKDITKEDDEKLKEPEVENLCAELDEVAYEELNPNNDSLLEGIFKRVDEYKEVDDTNKDNIEEIVTNEDTNKQNEINDETIDDNKENIEPYDANLNDDKSEIDKISKDNIEENLTKDDKNEQALSDELIEINNDQLVSSKENEEKVDNKESIEPYDAELNNDKSEIDDTNKDDINEVATKDDTNKPYLTDELKEINELSKLIEEYEQSHNEQKNGDNYDDNKEIIGLDENNFINEELQQEIDKEQAKEDENVSDDYLDEYNNRSLEQLYIPNPGANVLEAKEETNEDLNDYQEENNNVLLDDSKNDKETNKEQDDDYLKQLFDEFTTNKYEVDDFSYKQQKIKQFNKKIYDSIISLYPYLSDGFIKGVYELKTSFTNDYKEGEKIVILHRLIFKEIDKLRKFVDIMINHNYLVNVDEKQMIVDTFKEHINSDGKILTDIFEIANQAKLLDGEYDGYRIIEVDN